MYIMESHHELRHRSRSSLSEFAKDTRGSTGPVVIFQTRIKSAASGEAPRVSQYVPTVLIMENRQNISTNRDDIKEQWLNADLGSDEEENSVFARDALNSNSDNEFSDNDEDFVVESDNNSNSEISENKDESE
ncbi:hypothetical protein EVAR_66482_1 [Eumeta japonica]|uniref:Uncharacterized protein n=1 Tax=Eumeta variegata TaxID=151549 RepID=A0A4C2A201_EUMVA|nr:hypothetical protein EVAR_66482_1 [Eumeta japonica]